jgi:hypothetical protein
VGQLPEGCSKDEEESGGHDRASVTSTTLPIFDTPHLQLAIFVLRPPKLLKKIDHLSTMVVFRGTLTGPAHVSDEQIVHGYNVIVLTKVGCAHRLNRGGSKKPRRTALVVC